MIPNVLGGLVAVAAGYVVGGRLSHLAAVRVRWPGLALAGLALQFVFGPGAVLPMLCLYASFALLIAFAAANLRLVGFPLIALGTVLNLTVIGFNGGMPVSRAALVAVDDVESVQALASGELHKHHLASDDDVLLFLGDVVVVPVVDALVSVGDLVIYAGFVAFVITGMRGRASGRGRPRQRIREEVLDGV